jgi:hypothetical protein
MNSLHYAEISEHLSCFAEALDYKVPLVRFSSRIEVAGTSSHSIVTMSVEAAAELLASLSAKLTTRVICEERSGVVTVTYRRYDNEISGRMILSNHRDDGTVVVLSLSHEETARYACLLSTAHQEAMKMGGNR